MTQHNTFNNFWFGLLVAERKKGCTEVQQTEILLEESERYVSSTPIDKVAWNYIEIKDHFEDEALYKDGTHRALVNVKRGIKKILRNDKIPEDLVETKQSGNETNRDENDWWCFISVRSICWGSTRMLWYWKGPFKSSQP